ncbi:L-seryl-tRNA(Sec) selenium transferase [Noviherbaspirillum pedocola]|uniref:L-seryl-tRNA(Sec) selenium transferase n=1 Tax=Noviherbaspirillum pedocola TaxID=2801341 RepID=A0A934W2Q9_9BURK|nr:L-seryl-tRNA(Sec) selenium transferase [Noviherbaspirillum pedocola]MBK4736586.1 L-seryl-tRNA(Sec) selenium transferase [Noviherbaspirillum pedocola]
MSDSPLLKTATLHAAREALQRLPQLQRLLETPTAQALLLRYRREHVAEAMRDRLDALRQSICAGAAKGVAPYFVEATFFIEVRDELARRHASRLVRVINATGIALHTNLGRAPLAAEALDAIVETAAGYCNLEFDLATGERGSRHALVEERLCRLTGGEAALAVNNGAAAVLLALMALAAGGEVIVSRGELIEIGGSFRIPDVIAQSGARLVEVGATNKTRIDDYRRAIGPATRVLLASHPSNFRITGFTERPPREQLAALAREHGLPFIEDLGSGALVGMEAFGLPHEPTVAETLRAGADLVSFSGDKLLGGPQAGILIGRKEIVARLKRHPLLRALRCDKLALAALEATLALYEAPTPPQQRVPLLRMLAETPQAVARRARRLAGLLRAIPGLDVVVAQDRSPVGGGSLPGDTLPSTTLLLKTSDISADGIARRLRQARPAVIGRIARDRFILDLRTVNDAEVRELARLVAEALAASSAS